MEWQGRQSHCALKVAPARDNEHQTSQKQCPRMVSSHKLEGAGALSSLTPHTSIVARDAEH